MQNSATKYDFLDIRNVICNGFPSNLTTNPEEKKSPSAIFLTDSKDKTKTMFEIIFMFHFSNLGRSVGWPTSNQNENTTGLMYHHQIRFHWGMVRFHRVMYHHQIIFHSVMYHHQVRFHWVMVRFHRVMYHHQGNGMIS